MYLASEALRLMAKTKKPAFTADEAAVLANYKKNLDKATKFIPTWVKVAVALALGLGTMVGWKRIVVTVGEKIGKDAPDLRAGRLGRAGGDGHHPGGGRLRLAGQHHARALLRRGRNHDGQQERAAVVDDTQHRDGVGLHVAGSGDHGGGRCSGSLCNSPLRASRISLLRQDKVPLIFEALFLPYGL